ncbi:hypothetical protein QVD17_01283 [Tagetes erecta]|uniref:Uncharacterized protein n=1 Tax=Tagetes erecta TaxID=13708 RepID=A0AAD8L9E8_TARER|nr:hypothetical protein QVD17_01283 [Tagetes erecta]
MDVSGPKFLLNDMPMGGDDEFLRKSQEDGYRRRRSNHVISPERHDVFVSGDITPKSGTKTYADTTREATFEIAKEVTLNAITRKRKNRWDQAQDHAKKAKSDCEKNKWDETPTINRHSSRWDETPTTMGSATPGVTLVGEVEVAPQLQGSHL